MQRERDRDGGSGGRSPWRSQQARRTDAAANSKGAKGGSKGAKGGHGGDRGDRGPTQEHADAPPWKAERGSNAKDQDGGSDGEYSYYSDSDGDEAAASSTAAPQR